MDYTSSLLKLHLLVLPLCQAYLRETHYSFAYFEPLSRIETLKNETRFDRQMSRTTDKKSTSSSVPPVGIPPPSLLLAASLSSNKENTSSNVAVPGELIAAVGLEFALSDDD